MSKLQTLADLEGYESKIHMLGNAIMDSVVPGICMVSYCDYTSSVEPDQRHGWCEECERNTVASCLAIAGMM